MKPIRHLQRAKSKTAVAAAVLEDDADFRGHYEQMVGEHNAAALFRDLEKVLGQREKGLEHCVEKLDALMSKAERKGTRLDPRPILIDTQRMLGAAESDVLDAEAHAEEAEDRFRSQKELYDDYRRTEPRVHIASPVLVTITEQAGGATGLPA
jgi:hypothetical protein